MSGTTGTFDLSLSFNGNTATITSLPFGDTAGDVQAQIGILLTDLGISGATVAVTQTGSYYTVVLGGSLAGNTPALIAITPDPGTGDIVSPVPTVTTTQGGDPSQYFVGSALPVDGGITTVASSTGLGAATGSVYVQNGSSLQLEANVTVAGKNLVVSGTGAPTVGDPLGVNWFVQGPAPVVNGTTLGTNPAPVAGYVTDIAVDPTDPLTMYITTAGGGVWKTQNGGKTWTSIWNDAQSVYDGVIALDPTDPLHIYVGTGLLDYSMNSFAGTGLYQSYDGGVSWSLITGAGGANPFFGRAITAIAFDPFDPDNAAAVAPTAAHPDGFGPVLYISDSDQTVDGYNGVNGAPDPAIGVFRLVPVAGQGFFLNPEHVPAADLLFNLTNTVSWNRDPANMLGSFKNSGNPGPDDDFRMNFPQMQAAWTDVKVSNGVLFAAMGSDIGDAADGYEYPCDLPEPAPRFRTRLEHQRGLRVAALGGVLSALHSHDKVWQHQ